MNATKELTMTAQMPARLAALSSDLIDYLAHLASEATSGQSDRVHAAWGQAQETGLVDQLVTLLAL